MQHGFQSGRSTESQLLQVYHDILGCLAQGKEVDAIYLDLSKAFDKVPHHLLIAKLSSYGVAGNLLLWYHSYLSDRHQRVVLDGVYSNWLPVTSGVPQGSILGPLLFLIFVNDIPDHIRNESQLALFADDTKLYRALDTSNAALLLQQDLNGLETWSVNTNMTFSIKKCKTLHISRKKKPTTASPYYLDGKLLECVPHIKDLGITISNKLQWDGHIEEMTAKANKILGLIKRVCFDIEDQSVRKLLYCSLVLPRLEYCSCLWSPYSLKHRALIENIQRRATKFILNYPATNASYLDRLLSLHMLPLEYRRQMRDLLLLYKFKTGRMPINTSNYFIPMESYYRTRNFDPNNLLALSKHKQTYFQYSYFPRAVKLWNDLPSNCKECHSVELFKTKVLAFYYTKLETYSPP